MTTQEALALASAAAVWVATLGGTIKWLTSRDDRIERDLNARINIVREEYVRKVDLKDLIHSAVFEAIRMAANDLRDGMNQDLGRLHAGIEDLNKQVSRIRHRERATAMRVVAIASKLGLPELPDMPESGIDKD